MREQIVCLGSPALPQENNSSEHAANGNTPTLSARPIRGTPYRDRIEVGLEHYLRISEVKTAQGQCFEVEAAGEPAKVLAQRVSFRSTPTVQAHAVVTPSDIATSPTSQRWPNSWMILAIVIVITVISSCLLAAI